MSKELRAAQWIYDHSNVLGTPDDAKKFVSDNPEHVDVLAHMCMYDGYICREDLLSEWFSVKLFSEVHDTYKVLREKFRELYLEI